MYESARGPAVPVASGRHARLPAPAALRRVCVVTLIALVVQFSLGMILNLYVPVPDSDQHASYLQEIKTAPPMLTAHVLVGLVLIGAAIALLIRAIGLRNRLMIALTAVGLGAILGAFAAGEMFVRDGKDSLSLTMTILTAVALVCYIGTLGRAGTLPRPATPPLPRQAAPASRPRLAAMPRPPSAAWPHPTSAAWPHPPSASLPRPPSASLPHPTSAAALPGPERPSPPPPGYPAPVPLPRRTASGPQPRLANPPTGPQPLLGRPPVAYPRPFRPPPRPAHPYPPDTPTAADPRHGHPTPGNHDYP